MKKSLVSNGLVNSVERFVQEQDMDALGSIIAELMPITKQAFYSKSNPMPIYTKDEEWKEFMSWVWSWAIQRNKLNSMSKALAEATRNNVAIEALEKMARRYWYKTVLRSAIYEYHKYIQDIRTHLIDDVYRGDNSDPDYSPTDNLMDEKCKSPIEQMEFMDDVADKKYMRYAVKRMLEKLPVEQRVTIILKYSCGAWKLTNEDFLWMSSMCGKSVEAIKNMIKYECSKQASKALRLDAKFIASITGVHPDKNGKYVAVDSRASRGIARLKSMVIEADAAE